MELARRVRASFLLVVILMGLAGGVLIWNQVRMQKAFDTLLATVDLENILLECRREEKNFFLRKQIVHAEQVRSHLEVLARIVASVEPLTSDIGNSVARLEQRRVDYAEAFERAVESPAQIDPEDPSSPLVQAARACHELVEEIRVSTADEFERMSSTIHIVNFASILLAALVSVFLAGYLTDRILDFRVG